MFYDWVFFKRMTDSSGSFFIATEPDRSSPLVGGCSLRFRLYKPGQGEVIPGDPLIASVVGYPDPTLFLEHSDSGRIRTVFQKRNGLGFEDQGFIFFSSVVEDPLEGTDSYAVYYSSGGGSLRVERYPTGIHDIGNSEILESYSIPFSGSDEPVVLQAEWIGGVLAQESGGVRIVVSFGSNTLNFNNLVELSPPVTFVPDNLFPDVRFGIFARSRHSTELLYTLVDMTSIYRSNIL